MKKLKCFVQGLFILIYLLPIGIIIYLSETEMDSYRSNEELDIVEKAYGEIFQVERSDMKESLSVNAVGISNKIYYISSEGKDTIWKVKEGDEIFENQAVGYNADKIIKSKYNGTVLQINEKYIKLESLEDICLVTYIADDQVKFFQNKLQDEVGNKVKNIQISNRIEDGKVKVQFTLENNAYKYGQEVNELELFTGVVYENVLAIRKSCIYQKEDGLYYVRVVDMYGNYLGEQNVQIGFEGEEMICVTGLEEGTWCDGGYSAFENIEEEEE